ncbi:MAG: F0F1 ATP synthase subunit B family protein [Erythrobacter sp.]
MLDMINMLASGLEAGSSEPAALGFDSYQWVGLSMLILLGVFVWKKVPGMVTGGLDAKIAEIAKQLDEAKALRAEAEALRDEYAAKIADAEKDAEAMREGARREADSLLAKAEADSEAMVARRQKMAEDKIAAAEREAIADVKAKAVAAATAASRKLIAERHDSAADSKLADQVIASL